MSILSRFTKNTSFIFKSAVEDVLQNVEYKLENSVADLFSRGLQATGINSQSGRSLTSRFGDAVVGALADEFFREVSTSISRVAPFDIFKNVAPRYAETAFQAQQRTLPPVDPKNYYRYPLQSTGDDNFGYYLQIRFYQYQRTTPTEGFKRDAKHTIILPLPKDLNDSVTLDIETQKVGLTGAIADALPDIIRAKKEGKMTEELANKVGEGAMYLGAKTINDKTNNILGQYAGTIPNPYMSTFFQGVNMRTHQFQWTLSPRNKSESLQLKNIINILKASALPAFSPETGTFFLQYPLMCQVDLYPWAGKIDINNNVDKLISFKPTLIDSITVNYSPNGIPSFFEGTKLPTFVQLNLSMKELEYFTAEDYGRKGDQDLASTLKTSGKELIEKTPDIVKNIFE